MPATGQVREPQRVHAVYFLQNAVSELGCGDTVCAHLMPPADALVALCRTLLAFNPADRSADSVHIRRLARMTASVPVRILEYPRTFEALPAVAGFIQNEVNSAVAFSS
jgi:hypothetical protein